MGKPESIIENYLVNQAKINDCICWKFVSPSTSGVPDRILIGMEHVIFIETKAPGEKPRRLQKTIINLMRKKGAVVLVIDTKQQIDKLFDALKKGVRVTNENWSEWIC